MKTHRLLRASAAASLAMLCLAGCDYDSLVIFKNADSSNVHLLGPGETAGPINELPSGGGRQYYSCACLKTFTAARAGQILATKQCNVPTNTLSALGSATSLYLLVTWTGSQITCEVIDDEQHPDSGTGTSGRSIPSAILLPFSP